MQEMAAAFEGMKTDKEKDEAIRYGGDQTEKKVVDLTMPHPGKNSIILL